MPLLNLVLELKVLEAQERVPLFAAQRAAEAVGDKVKMVGIESLRFKYVVQVLEESLRLED